VDPYRRNLQRAWLETLDLRLNRSLPGPNLAVQDDARALIRAELLAIQGQAGAKARSAADPATRAHLADLKAQAARILDPKLPLPVFNPVLPGRTGYGCWPEPEV